MIPRSGRGGTRTALTLTTESEGGLDVGPDGSVYANLFEHSFPIVRFPLTGGHAERLVALPDVVRLADGVAAAALPDGRIVVVEQLRGHPRLMVIEARKAPRALIPTREDTAGPVTAVGPGDVAFLIGPEPRQTIALAEVAAGRITRRIPFDKGRIRSLAASPDGQTLYVAAGGTIWSLPASSTGSSDAPRKIRTGDSAAMDPSGRRLVVQVNDTPRMRLFDVPVNGGAEREIPLHGPFVLPDFALNPSSISADGRLLAPVASSDSWFYSPGVVDLATGTVTRIPIDHLGDYWVLLPAPGGQVMAGAFDDRSTLWRFQPEAAKK